MFKLLIILGILFNYTIYARDGFPDIAAKNLSKKVGEVRISALGMGVAPQFAHSPAQAYALAKRAAMVEAYRLLAERVGGVKIEGKDTIKNMEVTRSEVRAYVKNSIKNAEIIGTTFKDGMCEVELEVVINYQNLLQ
ncbi:MAG: hypothetical protein COB17_02290 [Sulfurimonas sp.]|nr:MAG: hypothetical protein COB17_02290 [Sulfurimonas sp.]